MTAAQSPFALRAAVAADLPALVALAARCFPQPYDTDLAADFARPQARLDVAHGGPTIVGFVNYWVGPECELLAVAVDPMARGAGIGRRLVERVLAVAAPRRVVLEVRAANTTAQRLYERAGFACVGRRPAYYRDGEDAIVMAVG